MQALAVASTALIATACAPVQAASGKLQFESGGQARTAFVVERQRLKRGARATLIILHGGSGSGLRTRRILGLEDVIRTQGLAVVYPDATDGKWDLSDKGFQRDSQMLRDLIRKLVDERITDRRRVYLLGLSTGGMVALNFACQSADMVAGAGALIAQAPESVATACKPARPLPLVLLQGTANPYIPYNGGAASLRDYRGTVASVDATLAPFKAVAGCADTAKRTEIPDKDPRDLSRVYIDLYNGCKVPIELIKVEGGGHSIPGRWGGPTGGGVAPGPHNNDIDASRLIWDFFKRVGA